jgi:glutamate/tyrosine decarboxylase-like PLP-dependent enzyme
MGKNAVLDALAAFKAKDLAWRRGRVFAYVYDPGPELEELAAKAYLMYLNENALDPTAFPSLVRLEVEVVRMIADLLRGDECVVGNFTSGGTESILLAVKTARDLARVERPHITEPEIVLPRTAHSAFHKAAWYFGLKPVVTPVNPATFQADVDAMRNAITPNTVLLVGSAPGYAQGVIDPVEEIGRLALERNLLFHVDACVGGIHLSFMRLRGYEVRPFDFSVPGVTSISADMHKYGYAPKGASTVLYRNKQIRQYQLFACAATATYALINTTVLSTKSGGPIAAAWAMLKHLGVEGYGRIVDRVQSATRQLVDGINAIPALRVLGKPDMCMFSLASDELNVFELADKLSARGWYVQPQFSTEQTPENLHVTVTLASCGVIDDFLFDLRDTVERLTASPDRLNTPALREQVRALARDFNNGAAQEIGAMTGLRGTDLPETMALINTALDALPDSMTEELLIRFMNDLYA